MINWNEIEAQAGRLLSDYLKIPSLNPPGDEQAAAEYLAGLLQARGFALKLFTAGPRRVNLTARLPGDGSKRPILLYNHMDVVEADRRSWSCDPFGGDIRDGYVWGRGAIDMKGMGIIQLLALDLLRQHQPQRRRDIIFFAAADEEKGGHFGAQWMIAQHWDELAAEYVWDEGSFGLQDFFGPQPVFAVAVTEKRDLWLKLIAHGEPGHSGMPHSENAVVILLRALERVQRLAAAYELPPVPQRMFADVSSRMPFPQSFLLKHLSNPLVFRLALPALSANPTIAAMLKDTLSITMLHAGGKENVIPDRAEATLDLRLLPDRTPEDVVKRLSRLINDPRVEIEILQSPTPAATSDSSAEFFQVLSGVLTQLVPDSLTTTMLSPGTTDSAFFRQRGVQCYGLFPAILTPGELARFHGHDERISLANLRLGVQIMFETLRQLAA